MGPICVDLNFSSSLDINGNGPYLYVVVAFGRLRPWYFGLDSYICKSTLDAAHEMDDLS